MNPSQTHTHTHTHTHTGHTHTHTHTHKQTEHGWADGVNPSRHINAHISQLHVSHTIYPHLTLTTGDKHTATPSN